MDLINGKQIADLYKSEFLTDKGLMGKKDTKSKKNVVTKKIKGWPNGLADDIRSKAQKSEFNYFEEPMMSVEDLERILSEPTELDPNIAAKYIYE